MSAKIIEFPITDDRGPGAETPNPPDSLNDAFFEQLQDLAAETRRLIREIRFAGAESSLSIDARIRLEDLARWVGA